MGSKKIANRMFEKFGRQIRRLLGSILLAVPLAATASPIWEYVGSFNVFDGPSWQETPTPMSARQVAAMLYGGAYTDYAISIVDSQDWTTVTRTAWVDGFGDIEHLLTAASEDFFLAPPSGQYDDFPAFSAWVCDHADCVADGYPVNVGWDGFNYTNYVWRITNSVSEPPVWGLMLVGMGGLYLRRRRKNLQSASANSGLLL